MPAESLPVVAFVLAMFLTFIAVVGGVWVWSSMPEWRTDRRRRPRTRHALRALQIKPARS